MGYCVKNSELVESLSGRNIIKISNNLCKARLNIKWVSLDIFMLLLTEISKEDTELKEFSVSLVDIEKKLEKKINRSPKNLQNICKDLTEDNLALYNSTEFMPLCSKCELVKEENIWVMQIKINPKLQGSLLNLTGEFAQINFQDFLCLDGGYAKKMYMLLISVSGLDKCNMHLETLYTILPIPKSYANKFNNFKRRVLDQSIESINRLETLNVSYHIEGKNKAIIFKVKRLKKKKSQDHKRKNMNMEEWDLACAGKLYNDEQEVIEVEVVKDAPYLQNVANR